MNATMTDEVRTERLTQLRRVVEAAPEERFRMEMFADEDNPCGTAYCAAGWAAIDPWFQANTTINEFLKPCVRGGKSALHLCYDIVETVNDGLAEIFGLRPDRAANLFNGKMFMGVTRADVLANIDRLLAGDEALAYDSADPEGVPT